MFKIIFTKEITTPMVYTSDIICKNESELFLTLSVSTFTLLLFKISIFSNVKKYSGKGLEISIEMKGNKNAKTDIVSNVIRQISNLLHLPNNSL